MAGAPGGGSGGMSGDALMQGAKYVPPRTGSDEEEGPPKPYRHEGRHKSSLLMLLGSISLILAVVAPWWQWSLSTSSQSATYMFFVWGSICFGPSCPGSSNPLEPGTSPVFAGGAYGANLGFLYLAVGVLAGLAVVFAIISYLIMRTVADGHARRHRAVDQAILLTFIGTALAIALPILVATGQSSAFGADFSFPKGVYPNPATSFSGTGNAWGAITYSVWGPTYSWYLAVLGAFCLFAGGVAATLSRHDAVTRLELIQLGEIKPRRPAPRRPPAPYRRPLPPAAYVGAPQRPRPLPAPAYNAPTPPRALPPPRVNPAPPPRAAPSPSRPVYSQPPPQAAPPVSYRPPPSSASMVPGPRAPSPTGYAPAPPPATYTPPPPAAQGSPAPGPVASPAYRAVPRRSSPPTGFAPTPAAGSRSTWENAPPTAMAAVAQSDDKPIICPACLTPNAPGIRKCVVCSAELGIR